MKFIKAIAICATSCFSVVAASESVKEVQEVSLPSDLTPVSQWQSGFTVEQANSLRNSYQATDYAMGNDRTVYGYLNIPEIITTMDVQRRGAVASLPYNPMPNIEEVKTLTKIGEMNLESFIKDPRSRVQGIAIAHKGKVVFEQYPGMPKGNKHTWNSASKTITGLLIHLYAEKGLIKLEDTVDKYLPFLTGTDAGSIKIENYLHHRTGLDYLETQKDMENPKSMIGRALGSAVTPRGVPKGESINDILMEAPQTKAADTVFEYSSLNTQVLGLILESVAKKTWNEIASDHLWSKIGMEGDATVGLSASGEPLNGGVFSSTLMDMLRYGLIFTPSWNLVSDKKIVSEDYFSQVYAASTPEAYLKGYQGKRMYTAFEVEGAPYGTAYQWDAVFSDGDLFKAGLNGQGIYVSPETDTVVVYFATSWRNSINMNTYARAIVQQLFR